MAQSGKDCPDSGNCLHHPLILHRRRFAPLQHKGTEAQPIAFMATRKNLLLRQLITGYVPVLLPYAAIVAVIAATVGYLNQSANEDFIAKAGKRFFPSKLLQVGCKFCVPAKKHGFILFGIQPAVAPQFVNQMLHINGQRANTSLSSLPTPASAGAFRQLFHCANMAR